MAIERQGVQGLQQVQATGAPRGSGTQAIQVSPVTTDTTRSSFFGDLVNAAGSLAQVGTAIMNQAVEDDKVRQMDRAMSGLVPTDDATRGGTRAHMLVNLQNDVLSSTAQLQEQAKTFQGSDKEWEDHVVNTRNSIQQKLFTDYPELSGDKNTMKMVSASFMEQQPKVFGARVSAKLEQEAYKRQESMRSRILSVTSGLSGDQLGAALNQMKKEAGTLQLTSQQYEGLVADVALNKAAVGDTSLIEGTKHLTNESGLSLYERTGKLQQGAIEGLRVNASLNQAGLAGLKYDLEQRYTQGSLDNEGLLRETEQLNKATGGTAYGSEAIVSLMQQKQKTLGAQAKLEVAIDGIQKGKLVGLENLNNEEIGKVAAGVRKGYDDQAELLIKQQGLDPKSDEAASIRSRAGGLTAVALAKADIKDDIMVRQGKALLTLSPDHLQTMTSEGPELSAFMEKVSSMPEDTWVPVLGEDVAAMVTNYRRGLSDGRNPGQALQFAQDASKKRTFSSEENKAINKGVKSSIEAVMKGSGWVSNDMPDYLQGQISRDADELYRTYRKAGYNDEDAEKQTVTSLQKTWQKHSNTMASSGTIIKGNPTRLASKLKVNEGDLGLVFQSYLQQNKQQLEDPSGGLTVDDMYVDIDQERGVFRIRAGGSGMIVTDAKPISELNGADLLRKGALMSDKEKEEADARMANNYTRAMGSGVNLNTPNYPTFKQLTTESESIVAADDEKFHEYVAANENAQRAGFDNNGKVYTPFQPDDEMPDVVTVGYGHRITEQEARDGFIMVGDNPVPFKAGQSKMTEDLAKQLMVQDLQTNAPSTEGWKVSGNDIPKAAWRAIQDASYTMGGGFLSKSKTAAADFKEGRFGDGLVHLLDTVHEGGKRKNGLLMRRAMSYNMYAGSILQPKIKMVETNEDGSMRVKFDRKPTEGLSKSILNSIDEEGWYTVVGAKSGSLHKNTKTGRFAVQD